MKSTIAAAVLIVAALNMPAYAEAAATGTATANSNSHRQEELRSAHLHTRRGLPTTRSPMIAMRKIRTSAGTLKVACAFARGTVTIPKFPDSGYTCRDVNVLGMAMRECQLVKLVKVKTVEYRETPPARREHACGPIRRSGAASETPCRD